MDNPAQQPASPSNPNQPPQVVILPPKPSGCGCLTAGCMSFLVAGLVIIIILLVSSWFLYVKAVSRFSSAAPVSVAVAAPTDEGVATANSKLDRLHEAIRQNQAITVAFTAGDLNALIARNPDFARHKGKIRIEIADSLATVEMSLPLFAVSMPGIKHRWFNGSARLRFSFDNGDFDFDPEWIEANGHELSGGWLRTIARTFSGSFTQEFEDSMEKNSGANFWKNVKTMSLEGDQLIITTYGDSASST